MSGADAFTAFMAARYDEADARARAATPGRWAVRNLGRHDLSAVIRQTGETPVMHMPEGPLIAQFDGGHAAADSLHVAATGPEHRLADITLKRAILASHRQFGADLECARCVTWDTDDEGDLCATPLPWPCPTARQLGTEFAGHPEYKEGWQP